MTKTHLLIAALVIAHLLGTVLFGYWADRGPTWPTAVFIGLIFSQTSLLGMWVGLGKLHYVVRLIGLAFGVCGIGLVLGLGFRDPEIRYLMLVFVATIVVTVVTWLVRVFKAQISHVFKDQIVGKEGLQFTIKHLFVLTFTVACLTTLGKLLAPHIRGSDIVNVTIVIGLAFGAVALTSIWAMLGLGHPIVRSIFVFMISVATGCSLAYLVQEPNYFFWAFMFFMQALFLTASLAVCRAIGFRLVAKQVESD